MTVVLTTWLAFVTAVAVVAWFAPRATVALVVVACATLPAGFYALGHPTVAPLPEGEFDLIGARIDEGVAIYALVSAGGNEPIYYRLPYSEKAANDLQRAQNAARAGSGTVVVTSGESGAIGFSEGRQRREVPKRVERPMINNDRDAS